MVSIILDALADGMTEREIIAEYPTLTTEGIRAAVAGHYVDTARAEGLQGVDDPRLLAAATREGRLLVTLDRGLVDIRAYPPGTHAGYSCCDSTTSLHGRSVVR